jgi:lysophospholipase L1-like esterase
MEIRLLCSLLASLLLIGCVQNAPMNTTNTEYPFRFLALGDSYTIGQGVDESDRWPIQLAAALRERSIQISDPEIVARTGWTTADLLRGIEEVGELGQYDLVSLLIGVNDQFQGLAIEGYRERFRGLLAIAVKAAGGRAERVIVLSIPDWSFTPFAEMVERREVSTEINMFNEVGREESELAGVHFFNITSMTRPIIYDEDLIADDGLHYSAKMYAMWVEAILPSVVEILDKNE